MTAITALALILQSLLAADLMAAIVSDNISEYRTITICTGSGYNQVTLDREDKPVKSPLNNGIEDCPACLLASANMLTMPVAFIETDRPARHQGQGGLDTHVCTEDPVSHAHRSRAPPRT